MIIIKKKRFILRTLEASDAKSIAKHANDWQIAKNLTDTFPYPYHLKDAKKYISLCQKKYKSRKLENIFYGIEIDGQIVGTIGCHNIVKGHKASIGYWIGKQHWGKGLMTEIVKAFMSHIFKKYNLIRVEAYAYSWNKASMKVMEKCGMKFEGVRRKNTISRGRIIDDYLWAKVK
jgi:[ribosomal protein S5]-alanine N-acetyltransferase